MSWLIRDLKFIAGVLLFYGFALTLGLLISWADKDIVRANGPLDMRCSKDNNVNVCESEVAVCWYRANTGISCLPKSQLRGLK